MELNEIRENAEFTIKNSASLEQLQQCEINFLGRKGSVTQSLRSIKNFSPEERKLFGQEINLLKQQIENLIVEKRKALIENSFDEAVEFDPTLPGVIPHHGSAHPILQMMEDINEAFLSLGFSKYDGPEISSEAYCFDSLNFPKDHPARESMDTYWLEGSEDQKGANRLSLRPHLTGASVRYMQLHEPPLRFVYPGRVYRNEATDAGHERSFFQYEALIIDRRVAFSGGRLLINTILERVFGAKVKTRMRVGFFPFVEPGYEIDIQCLVCSGSGCSVCKHVGWLELMPGGTPHPNVMRVAGIDPEKWQGFYLNVGLDRLCMMRHNIDDIRLFHSTDLRFLSQFS